MGLLGIVGTYTESVIPLCDDSIYDPSCNGAVIYTLHGYTHSMCGHTNRDDVLSEMPHTS